MLEYQSHEFVMEITSTPSHSRTTTIQRPV